MTIKLPENAEFLAVVNARLSDEFGRVSGGNIALEALCEGLYLEIERLGKRVIEAEKANSELANTVSQRDAQIAELEAAVGSRRAKMREAQAARRKRTKPAPAA